MMELEKQEQIKQIKNELLRLKEAQNNLPKESDTWFVNDLRIKELEGDLNDLARAI